MVSNWAPVLLALLLITYNSSSLAQPATNLPPQQIPPPVAQPSADTAATRAKEFEQWLQTNSYQQNQPASQGPPQTTTVAVTPSLPPMTTAINPPPGPPPIGAPVEVNMQPPKSPPPPPRLSYEQGQQAQLNSVPPTSLPPTDESNAAFNALLRQNMPLAPQQIVQLRQQIDMSQRAASITPNIPPKPVSTTIMVNLAPGTTPPAIRLAQGYVSSLVFVDSTGTPWPIAAFDIGNPKAVNIQWDNKSNILLLQAVLPYGNGDIVIRLVGLPTPITLELVAGQRVVDFRVDIHVPGIGPNTKDLPVAVPLPSGANQLLLGILDGIGPPGSRILQVQGADAQAWLLGTKLYLRTRLTVLSPGWIGTMISPDGMHAYELPKTSSVLVSRYGEPVALRIGGL